MANFYGELVVRITSDTSGLKKGLNEMAASTTAASGAVEKNSRLSAQRMEHVGRQMQNIGRQMTQFVTLPIVAGFGLAAVAGYRYEKSLQKIRNLTGTTAADTAKYGEALKALAIETGQSAFTMAEGFYYIASSGFKGADALKIMTSAAKAAAIGMGDSKVTSDLLTSALNAYGLSANKAAWVTDVLAKTIEVGKAEPEQLAASLGRIMPVANSLGVSIPELGGSVAALTLTGLSAAEAVTSLRGTMMALVAPGKQASDEMKKYGVTVKDLKRKIADEGLLAALDMLWKKTDGNQQSMRKIIPNIRALNGVLAALGPNYGKTVEAIAKVTDAQGALDKAFERTKQDKVFKMEQAWARIKVAFIDIGQMVLPAVAAALEWLAGKVEAVGNWLTGLSDGWKKWLLIAATTAAVLGPIIMMLGTFINALGLIRSLFVGWNIAATLGQIIGAARFAGAGGSGIASLAAAFSTFAASLGPVTVGLLAIAAAAGAIYGLTKLENWLDGTTQRLKDMDVAVQRVGEDTSGKLAAKLDRLFGGHLVRNAGGKIVWQPVVEVKPKTPDVSGLVKWIHKQGQLARNAIREENKMTVLEVARGNLAYWQEQQKSLEDKMRGAVKPNPQMTAAWENAKEKVKEYGLYLSQTTGQMERLQEAGAKAVVFAGLQDRQDAIGKQIVKVKELQALLAKDPGNVELGLKTEKAERRLDNLKRELGDYTKMNWQTILDVRIEKAKAKLKTIDQHLAWLHKQKPTPAVDAQIKAFEKKRKEVADRLAKLNATTATPTITANGSQAISEAGRVKAALDALKDRYLTIHINKDAQLNPQAAGGDYLVRKPTLFLAGEAGLERATFTPLRGVTAPTPSRSTDAGGDAKTTVINLTVQAVVPGGTTIVGTAKQVAETLAPYIVSETRRSLAQAGRAR